MSESPPDFTFTFHPSQRERFRDGSLAIEWKQKYPELFDDDDVRILQTAHQRKYHFFEWLSAILLFEATGYLSLVEGYTAKKQQQKRETLQRLLSPSLLEWLDKHQSGQPDLFVYHPHTGEWFFCEVKGGADRVRKNQQEWMVGFKNLLRHEQITTNGRVRVIYLRETGP